MRRFDSPSFHFQCRRVQKRKNKGNLMQGKCAPLHPLRTIPREISTSRNAAELFMCDDLLKPLEPSEGHPTSVRLHFQQFQKGMKRFSPRDANTTRRDIYSQKKHRINIKLIVTFIQ